MPDTSPRTGEILPRADMVLTHLGSGGWMPDDERETSAHLVTCGESAVLLDAGTGTRRLVTSPGVLGGVRRLDVVLSHFHLDHVVGLGYLDALQGVEVRIWGPGRQLYGTPTRELLDRLLAPPLLRADPTAELEVLELGPGAVELWVSTAHIRRQDRHTAPSLAVRLDDHLVYCTDTEHDPENAYFAAGASVLLHEAWGARGPVGVGHSSATEAAQVAAAAQVERLVLVHLPPGRQQRPLLDAAREVLPRSELAQDLSTSTIEATPER